MAFGVSIALGWAVGCGGGAAHRAQVADLRRTLERLRDLAPYARLGREVDLAPVGVVGRPAPEVIPVIAVDATGDVQFDGGSRGNVRDASFEALRVEWGLKQRQYGMLHRGAAPGPTDVAVAVAPSVRTDDVRRILAELPGTVRVHVVFRIDPNPMPEAALRGASPELLGDLAKLRAMSPPRRTHEAMRRTHLALWSCPKARDAYAGSFAQSWHAKAGYFLEGLTDAVAHCDLGLVDMVRLRALLVSEIERDYGRPSVLVPLEGPIHAEQASAMPTFGEFAQFLQRSYREQSASR